VVPFVENAAGFLVRYAPITQQERWEEIAGYSPSTLAAVMRAALRGRPSARLYGPGTGQFLEDYADWIEMHLDEWRRLTMASCCRRSSATTCAFGALRRRAVHNPNIPPGHLVLANREPGERSDFEARAIIDAGFWSWCAMGSGAPTIVDRRLAEGHRPCAEDRNPQRRLLAALQPRRLWPAKGRRAVPGMGTGACVALLGGERAL